MKRTLQAVFLTVFAVQALVIGQGADVKRVLADIRTALGGDEKLTHLTSVAVEGRTTRPVSDGSTVDQDFEMAFEMPATGAIKFMKKDAVMNLGGTAIYRRSGFNGDDVIDVTDVPPSMTSMNGNGEMRVMRAGPGGPAATTPEQVAAQKQQKLTTSRREFARLVLGMIGTTTAAYPVEFTYGGKVDAAGGKAEVLELKAVDGFAGRLYVDAGTHLPLMLSWMDKEPIRVVMGGPDGGTVTTGNGGTVRSFGTGGGMTPDDLAKMQADMAARVKEAEANRKTVEFRIFYADYKPVDGIKLPTRIQKMTDGLPTEELSLERIHVNGKIDPAKFGPGK